MKKQSKRARKAAAKAAKRQVQRQESNKRHIAKLDDHSLSSLPQGPRRKPNKAKERAEQLQNNLRDGTLHWKGKGEIMDSSQKKYSEASRSNPVQPPVYKNGIGYPSKVAPRSNRHTLDEITVPGLGVRTRRNVLTQLRANVLANRITLNDLVDTVGELAEANKFEIDPCAHVKGKRQQVGKPEHKYLASNLPSKLEGKDF